MLVATVKSRSRREKIHQITLDEGKWACSCESFEHEGIPCQHLLDLWSLARLLRRFMVAGRLTADGAAALGIRL